MQTLEQNKLSRLREIIARYDNVVVGFSGGIDSSLVLKIAVDTLGKDRVWAVTGDSESLLAEELELCRELASKIGLSSERLVEIKTEELSNPDYAKNPVNRCYFCKSELFDKLNEFAAEIGADVVLDGSNADDLNDWRPGRKAAGEKGVVSPLAEAGITKQEIREIALELGLPNWNKPALACLASRIPYGSDVTVEKLERIANAERFLRSLGFSQLRVRHYDKMARVELIKDELPRLFENGLYEKVSTELKSLGFSYVTVDLEGYRSGSMNEGIITKGEE